MWELHELLSEHGVCGGIFEERGRAFCQSYGRQGCEEFPLTKQGELNEHASEVCEDFTVKTHHVKDQYDGLKEYAAPQLLCETA